MKRKIITCDICDKEITHDKKKYKFKMYENDQMFSSSWTRLDMCEECWEYFLADVKNVRRKMSEED